MSVVLSGQPEIPPESCILRPQDTSERSASTYDDSQLSFALRTENTLQREMLDHCSFVYGKTFFKYDDYAYLRLSAPLTIALLGKKLSIKEWDATVDCPGYDGIDKAIIRFFQSIYQSVFDDTASPPQRQQWLRMIETFDYRFFSQGIAPAVYSEGVINSIKDEKVHITWDNGDRNICGTCLSTGFSNGRFIAGDRIGAFVKWNAYGVLSAIYDIRRLVKNDAANPSIEDIPKFVATNA